jgi:hypothetical protein
MVICGILDAKHDKTGHLKLDRYDAHPLLEIAIDKA